MKKTAFIISYILTTIILYGISFFITSGIYFLINLLLEYNFSWFISLVIWLILEVIATIVTKIIKGIKKYNESDRK